MRFDQFIDLDRRFSDVSELDDSEVAAIDSYTQMLLGREPGIGWSKLLLSPIVVILGERGSGKTWELRYRASCLMKEGHFAFFVPLDRLVESQLVEALSPENEVHYLEWKHSIRKATFFLDSVDEAKIRKQKDFAKALDNFVRGVGLSAIRYVHVVISSRISEWQSKADREELLQRFQGAYQPKEDDAKNSEAIPEIRIVQLEPLSRSRVQIFAQKIGLDNPESFLQAIDYQHAWEFARRPIDVADLANYWSEHGKLGTLKELIEFDLSNKLSETQERIQNDPLSSENVRIGAKCLGTAVVFCRRFSFFVPDMQPPENTSGAMIARDCLPDDWSPSMVRAMITRPVFDVASYGRIRFHHRRTAEYLAGSWLEDRLQDGCPYPDIEALLFEKKEGSWIIRPNLKPVTAWLALGDEYWNQRIRERILLSAPELFLTYGDPESLPLDYKKSLLENLIERYSGRERIFLDDDASSLSRLADSELSSFVANQWCPVKLFQK